MTSSRRLRAYARDEHGQTTVIIAVCLVVLLMGVALGVDWGYGFTQRRVMQNASDAGALAGARVLATSVIGQKQGNSTVAVYATYEEVVYCRAVAIGDSQRSFRPVGSTPTFVVQITSDVTQADPYVSPYGKTLSPPAGGCPSTGAPTTGTLVDPSIRYVRVASTLQFQGILGRAAGPDPLTASASAVARVTGTPVPTNGKTWPMLRHYNATDFQTTCNGACTPGNATPITFWDPNDPNMVYNDFMGLLDLSRFSPNALRNAPSGTTCATGAQNVNCVQQLVTHWDDSGDRFTSTGVANRFGGNACAPPAPAGKWYTDGDENAQSFDKDCSIQNWFYLLFQGQLSLTSDYHTIAWDGSSEFKEAPNDGAALSLSRSACASQPLGLVMPSCNQTGIPGNGYLGDWVEAAHTGNVGNNIATPLQAYIDDFGTGCDASDEFCNVPVGPGAGAPKYGKHVVINVYLWDCAETYVPGGTPGSQWYLTRPKTGSDCSGMQQGNDMNSHDAIDRVHLLTVAPFTFYRGLVDSNSIKGFWGGLVTDPGACQVNPNAPGCSSLGLFSNGVFLVPER